MLPKEIQKLRDLLRKIAPQVSGADLEKIAQNLSELGLLLVRLRLKEHPRPPETQITEEFDQITSKPP